MSIARRHFIRLLLASGAATSASACFGSFPAIQWVYSFNKEISGSKFIQWLVFLVLVIIPVYEVAALIDIWILNSLEFWFGGDDVADADADGDQEKVVDLGPGEELYMRKNHARGELEVHYRGPDESIAMLFDMTERRARVLDPSGRVIARAGERRDGGVDVYAGDVRVESHSPRDVRDVVETYDSGGAPAAAAWAAARVGAEHPIASRE